MLPGKVPVNVISPNNLEPVTSTTKNHAVMSTNANANMNTVGTKGRMKVAPVCVDASLQERAMATEMLQKLVFDDTYKLYGATESQSEANTAEQSNAANGSGSNSASTHTGQDSSAMPISSSSSTCTRESDTGVYSDAEKTTTTSTIVSTTVSATPQINRSLSDRLNAKISTRTISRQGRSSQRWITCNETGESIRLVTGCVPILQGGKVLLASSSRKPDWILPKGGWEQDERMEESAVRECFEEAGVLGILGPCLHEINYEPRKVKKRRLELEELEKMKKAKSVEASNKAASVDVDMTDASGISTSPAATTTITKGTTTNPADTPSTAIPITTTTSTTTVTNVYDATDSSSPSNAMTQQSITNAATTVPTPNAASNSASFQMNDTALLPPPVTLSEEMIARIRGNALQRQCDDTLSVASTALSSVTSGNYAHVRMILFPLYVTKVESVWPESGRFRTAMDIEEAIALLEKRPEFQAALIEVKERGLHVAMSNKRGSGNS